MTQTVPNRPPEGEPDHVTPCWACNGSGTTGGLDTDVFECTVCGGTGLSARHRDDQPERERPVYAAEDPLGVDTWAQPSPLVHFNPGQPDDQRTSCGIVLDELRYGQADTNPAKATCPPCAATLVDSQLTAPDPAPAPVEHRTVGLEVLTDEVRAAAEAGQAGVEELFDGAVGIVCRLNGAVIDVPELDTLWRAPFRKPADILSILLRQARMYADGLHGHRGAELLMPDAPVLAALAGQSLPQAWTVPLLLRADQVEQAYITDPTPGWQALSAVDEKTWHDITTVLECEDDRCGNAGCVVLVSAAWAGLAHLPMAETVTVRIPAAVTE